MALKIGITGGIGSGKTTVAKIFEVLGIPVYYADEAAKRLMNENAGVKDAIISEFGSNAYQNGELDRAFISAQVFNNKEKLARLNAITHPATILDAANWMSSQITPYAVKEAALIFESGSDKDLDFVIGVSAPESVRIQRTMHRDGVSVEEVKRRMRNQMDEKEKMNRCNFVITNDDVQPLLPQVTELHNKLLKLAASGNKA